MKKGEILEGLVERVKFPNQGLVRAGDDFVTVKNVIPGQKIRFAITRKKGKKYKGTLLETLEPSPLECRKPLCGGFPDCGGCLYQTVSIEEQEKLKGQEVLELTEKYLPDQSVWKGVVSVPAEFCYRNKMEFSFGDMEKDGPLTLGLHRKGSVYDVLNAEDCMLVHEDFNRILSAVLDYFREKKIPYYHTRRGDGYLRHLLIRRSEATGDLLVDLITTSRIPDPAAADLMLEELLLRLLKLDLDGKITGVLHTTNDSRADAVINEHTDVLYGQSYFYEELSGLKFRITPFSFFQTNTKGAEILYRTALDFLGDISGETVYDLYCGTGTITQLAAASAKKVIGVEIVEEAVTAAKQNARENGIENCEFLCGDVLKVIDEVEDKPDTIILDPPREGIHPKAMPKIIAFGVQRILYISCKPTSLAKDLEALRAGGYEVEKIGAVDMFPQTAHVETVALMSRVEGK